MEVEDLLPSGRGIGRERFYPNPAAGVNPRPALPSMESSPDCQASLLPTGRWDTYSSSSSGSADRFFDGAARQSQKRTVFEIQRHTTSEVVS